MINRKYRFHGHGSLNYLHRNGKVVRNNSLLVKYVPNQRRENNRVTVVVSKKVAKSAVLRNRIRRRIYEVVRLNWDKVAQQNDFMITVFTAEAAVTPFAELDKSVLGLLKRAGLYRTSE